MTHIRATYQNTKVQFYCACLLVSLLVLPWHSVCAQELLVLKQASSWENVANNEAVFASRAKYQDGYQLYLEHEKVSGDVYLVVGSPEANFSKNSIYAADIYFGLDDVVTGNGQPVGPGMLKVLLGEAGYVADRLQSLDELSVGIDDTLYVFDLLSYGVPFQSLTASIASSGLAEKATSNAAVDLDVPQGAPQNTNGNSLAQQAATASAPNFLTAYVGDAVAENVQSSYQPFLTLASKASQVSQVGTVLSEVALERAVVKPNLPKLNVVKPADDLQAVLSDVIDDAAEPQRQNLLRPQDQPNLRSERGYRKVSMAAADPVSSAPSVREISTLSSEAYPDSLADVRGHLSTQARDDRNEDAALIESLLIQLALLEREKEALRGRVAEQPTAISVIRSCSSEQGKISGLRGEVNDLQSDRFDLVRQLEINDELLSACEQSERQSLDLIDDDLDLESLIQDQDVLESQPPSQSAYEPQPDEPGALDEGVEEISPSEFDFENVDQGIEGQSLGASEEVPENPVSAGGE